MHAHVTLRIALEDCIQLGEKCMSCCSMKPAMFSKGIRILAWSFRVSSTLHTRTRAGLVDVAGSTGKLNVLQSPTHGFLNAIEAFFARAKRETNKIPTRRQSIDTAERGGGSLSVIAASTLVGDCNDNSGHTQNPAYVNSLSCLSRRIMLY